MTDRLLKYSAFVCRIVITLIVFLAVTLIIQLMAQQISMDLIHRKYYSNYQPPAWQTKPQELSWDQMLRSSQRHYLPDGTLHLVRDDTSMNNRMLPKVQDIEVYDTDLNKLWSGPAKDNPHKYIDGGSQTWNIERQDIQRYQGITPEFSRELIIPVIGLDSFNNFVAIENWRNSYSGYFTGYDKKSRSIGYISANGFSKSKNDILPLEKPLAHKSFIPEDSNAPVMLWVTEKKVYQLDFSKRATDLVYQSDVRISNIQLLNWPRKQDQTSTPAIYILDKNKRHVIREFETGKTIDLKLPEADGYYDRTLIHRYSDSFYLYIMGQSGMPNPQKDRKVFLAWFDQHRNMPFKMFSQLHSIAPDGTTAMLNNLEWTVEKSWLSDHDYDAEQKTYKTVANITSAPSSIIFMLSSHCLVRFGLVPDNRYGIVWGIIETLDDTWPSNYAYPILFSILTAAVASLHAWPRRTSNASLAAWLIFVLLFNLPGLLTYLALNHHELIKCANCGKKRHLLADNCTACGSPLPAPQKRPTDLILTTQSPPEPA